VSKRTTGYESQWNETYGLDKDPVRKYLIYPLIDEQSGDLSGKRILDAGSGNGGLLNYFADRNYGEAVGIDKSPEFVNAARANVPDQRVQFVEADLLEKLPFEDACFDLSYSMFVLNELPEISLHIQEMSRVLRSGGHLLVVATHPLLAMYYHLYERFTGKQNDKLIGIKGYFDQEPVQYVFTLAKTTATFFQHTFEELLNPLFKSGMEPLSLLELKTDNIKFQSMPSYWETRDVPKYLFLKARKR
jgi:ubiquinone/menaquinone biosynthesis C-methylase UbiE